MEKGLHVSYSLHNGRKLQHAPYINFTVTIVGLKSVSPSSESRNKDLIFTLFQAMIPKTRFHLHQLPHARQTSIPRTMSGQFCRRILH